MADFLKNHPGTALEIGCGSGRLLLPLLADGHRIEGLELSPDMLAICHKRAAEMALEPVLHRADMSTWNPEYRFAALMAPAFTLQLAVDALGTLRHWRGWLNQGGGLYLTIFIPFSEIEGDQPVNTWYPDHEARLIDGRIAKIETRHQIDTTHKLLRREHRYNISGDPREHESVQTLRWYEPEEITEIVEQAGFEVTRIFADFDPKAAVIDMEDPDFGGIITLHARRR